MLHSTDLQNVNITLRILYRPKTTALPRIYKEIGVDYDERVLPSIGNEVLKAVVVCASPNVLSNASLKHNGIESAVGVVC